MSEDGLGLESEVSYLRKMIQELTAENEALKKKVKEFEQSPLEQEEKSL